MAQQKVRIPIPKGYSLAVREEIANAVLDFIKNRTVEGKDKDNKKFVPYSKNYAEEKGVGRREVDLFASGDMLQTLSVIQVHTDGITIGYEKGDPINDIVEGNRLGSYGGTPDSSKARDFLGITDKDLNKILAEFPTREEQREINKTIDEEYQDFTPEQRKYLKEEAWRRFGF